MSDRKLKNGRLGCVILAGGKSTRMGMDKALVEYNGETFIKRLTREFDWFEEKIIARGDQAGLQDTFVGDWRVIPDVFRDHGPLGGLHAALSDCESEALFVVTCDMPRVKSSLARRLQACWEETRMQEQDSGSVGVDAVIVVDTDGRVHPLCGIYSKSVLPVVEEQLKAEKNRMMELLRRLQVCFVAIKSETESGQLANINTVQELKQL